MGRAGPLSAAALTPPMIDDIGAGKEIGRLVRPL